MFAIIAIEGNAKNTKPIQHVEPAGSLEMNYTVNTFADKIKDMIGDESVPNHHTSALRELLILLASSAFLIWESPTIGMPATGEEVLADLGNNKYMVVKFHFDGLWLDSATNKPISFAVLRWAYIQTS